MIDAKQTAVPAMAVPAYTVTARVLHWLTAALVLVQIPLGIVIANEWGGERQEPLYDLHKSIGAVILPLVIVRLIHRVIHPPLPLPADIPAKLQLTAHVTHWTLYALLIAQSCSAGSPPRPIRPRSRCSACSSCPRSGRRTSHFPSGFSSCTDGWVSSSG